MENCDNLQIGAAVGLPQADTIASALKNFGGSVRHKAQLKKALRYVETGYLSGLNGGMLDRLIESNMSPAYYINAPVYIQRIKDDPNFAAAMAPRLAAVGINPSGQPTNNNPTEGIAIDSTSIVNSFKKYLPYIIVGAILIYVIYKFVLKK